MGSLSLLDTADPASPTHAVGALRDHLSAAGMRRLYMADHPSVASLSVRTGLTVWCMAGHFWWRDELGQTMTHPADDPEGAARRLLALAPAQQAVA